MFLYRVKYADSESDIKNNDLLYKIDQQCQNTFDVLEPFKKITKTHFLFCYIYKLHNSHFVVVWNVCKFSIFCSTSKILPWLILWHHDDPMINESDHIKCSIIHILHMLCIFYIFIYFLSFIIVHTLYVPHVVHVFHDVLRRHHHWSVVCFIATSRCAAVPRGAELCGTLKSSSALPETLRNFRLFGTLQNSLELACKGPTRVKGATRVSDLHV